MQSCTSQPTFVVDATKGLGFAAGLPAAALPDRPALPGLAPPEEGLAPA